MGSNPVGDTIKKIMKITEFQRYRDGGTTKIVTDEGVFCLEGRINARRKNPNGKRQWFDGYPGHIDSNPISEDQIEKLEQKIILSLKEYKHEFYQNSIDHLINDLENNTI